MATSEETPEKLQYADWMGNLPPHLHDIPLCRLAIPGSHDSGSFELRTDWEVGPDANAELKSLSSIPIIGAMAKDIIKKWSQCQSHNFTQQLNRGVRYFDLRVSHRSEDEDFYLVHHLYGPKLISCLEEVVTFLAEHPKEVVLLDFNHFYSMELEQHIQLITLLLSMFEGRLCPFSATDKPSLASLWQNRIQVIIFYQQEIVAEFQDLWPAASIASPWANTMDAERCLEYQEKHAKEQRREGKFHVCQAILTPSTQTIMQNLTGSVLAHCAKKINHKLPEWMRSSPLVGQRGMIYIVDFVEEDGFIPSVVSLNTLSGTHNSGCYSLRADWEASPDAPPLAKFLTSIPLLRWTAKHIMHKWGKCQRLSTLEQLLAGVRYLDLRVAYRVKDDQFYLVHSLYGPRVSDVLEDVKTFLQEHPKEVVLLDFNHFYLERGLEKELHDRLITYIKDFFGELLCPKDQADRIHLNSLWQNKRRVVVFYYASCVASGHPFLWPPQSISSNWADTMSRRECLAVGETGARNRRTEQFHVCQAVLTPSASTVIWQPWGSVESNCAGKINPVLDKWLCSGALQGHERMIYIADFVDTPGDFVSRIISLNK
ncbi:hypothetical protein BaRGS_00013622 [Batillaria attramentaria]|uniref:Phosphatidylinositol-specific phospholipase C X domain-containing protein n=1 Tax=Batillaria attramentaria TaxID=370345 RepID=A0ABD0L6X0_9CAEN